jgi:DNA-binding NarL/FixJ family response regulator
MIKIVIIDGQKTSGENITLILSTQQDFQILGTGRDGYDAINMVKKLKPDVVLLDSNLQLIQRTKVVSLLKLHSPASSIIILTTVDDDEYVKETICSGVSGYLLKDSNRDTLVEGVRTVYRGGGLLTPVIAVKTFRMVSDLVRDKSPQDRYQTDTVPSLFKISRTEFRITACIGQGLSNKEIAKNLNLREGTVRNYISSILQKTGLRDRTQVAIYALTNGLTG